MRRRTAALRPPGAMFPAKAKRVIFVFMQGGPSQVDTFDHKPALARHDGRELVFRDSRTLAKQGLVAKHRVMRSPWRFARHGESGHWVSELFPHLAHCVDDLCFLHGMHTNGVAHGPSTLFLHTGAANLIRPSVGAWLLFGLGSENENLPGFVTIAPSSANGGPRNYDNAFLPARYQGAAVGRAGLPARQAQFNHLRNPSFGADQQKQQHRLLRAINQAQADARGADDAMEAVLESYELAWRMQRYAPGVMDLRQETQATLDMYGVGQPATDDFGRQCLLARRLAEQGVRYIQVNYADNGSNPRWDQHSKIQKHSEHALATDQPVAALLRNLKVRGLLEDTLVWWGGEFGRNPFAQNSDGRDHNPKGFTHFLCGAGVKSGFSYGATDEFGHEAIAGKVHMHDLHATLLHLLGIDHERLTYRFAGREFRLTDIAGRVVRNILG